MADQADAIEQAIIDALVAHRVDREGPDFDYADASLLGYARAVARVARTEADAAYGRGFAEAVRALRDDARYERWWSALPQDHPDYGYWRAEPRRQFADYLEAVGTREPAERTEVKCPHGYERGDHHWFGCMGVSPYPESGRQHHPGS